jgi:hypothetical protein
MKLRERKFKVYHMSYSNEMYISWGIPKNVTKEEKIKLLSKKYTFEKKKKKKNSLFGNDSSSEEDSGKPNYKKIGLGNLAKVSKIINNM